MVVISAKLTPAERKALRWLSKRFNVTASGYLRIAIQAAARHHGAPSELMRLLMKETLEHPIRSKDKSKRQTDIKPEKETDKG